MKHIQKENRKIRIYVNGKGNSTIKSCLKIPYHLLLQVVYGRDYLKKFDLEIVEYIHENTKTQTDTLAFQCGRMKRIRSNSKKHGLRKECYWNLKITNSMRLKSGMNF